MGMFTLDQEHGGSFRADGLELKFNGNSLGSLAQGINVTFTQQVTTMYEIGSPKVYYVGGRAQGQAQVQRVIGPGAPGADPITGYNNICTPKNILVNAKAKECGNNGSGQINMTLESAVLTSFGISVQSQDVVINNQLGYMFIDLDRS